MSRRRWIADEYDSARNCAALTGEHAQHLSRVLRVKIGQQFDVAIQENGRPVLRAGTISSITDDRVEFDLGAELASDFAVREVTLLLAIFKFDRMEWAIEKSVELGARRIIPIIAGRTKKHLAAAAQKRSERWQRIAQEAAEQSRQPQLPEIGVALKFKDALAQAGGIRIVLSELGGRPLSEVFLGAEGEDLTLAIGPEGGWTSDELAAFTSAGFRAASLGPGILRAETAAIAALAVVMSLAQNT